MVQTPPVFFCQPSGKKEVLVVKEYDQGLENQGQREDVTARATENAGTVYRPAEETQSCARWFRIFGRFMDRDAGR